MRGDQKHNTNVSAQGSISSMQIKYVPSQMDPNGSQKKDNRSKKSRKSRQSRKSSFSKKKAIAASDVQVIENNPNVQRDTYKVTMPMKEETQDDRFDVGI